MATKIDFFYKKYLAMATTTIQPTPMNMHTISINDLYTNEILAMTIGHHGKNFIKWTEETPGINRIWHNKETNEIEISGDATEDQPYSKVKDIINNVLNFNYSIVIERQNTK